MSDVYELFEFTREPMCTISHRPKNELNFVLPELVQLQLRTRKYTFEK